MSSRYNPDDRWKVLHARAEAVLAVYNRAAKDLEAQERSGDPRARQTFSRQVRAWRLHQLLLQRMKDLGR